MPKYYNFAGTQIIMPGAYTDRNFPKQFSSGAAQSRAVLIGEATKGGVPYDAYTDIDDVLNVITDRAQALNVYGGGSLFYGTDFFLSPSGDDRFKKPSQAIGLIVNKMTRATKTIQNSTPTDCIKLDASKFGTDGNQLSYKIIAGTASGKKVSVMYKNEVVADKDDVNLPLFKIQYIGAGATCTLAISATEITIVSATGSESVTLKKSEFSTIGEIVNKLNGSLFTCELTGKSDDLTAYLDVVSAIDIKTAGVEVVGINEAVKRVFESTGVFDVTVMSRTIPANTVGFVALSGGTVSAATNEDWIKALAKLEKYDLKKLVVLSGSATIHGLVKDHVQRMNGVKGRKYRQALVGAGSEITTAAARVAAMKALNCAEIEYMCSPFKRFDYVNEVVPASNFEDFYLSALIAGFASANNIGMDIVFKYLDILSTPEYSPAELEAMTAAGGTIVQKTSNVLDGSKNFEIIANGTTFQGSQITRTNPIAVYMENVITELVEAFCIEQIRKLDMPVDDITMNFIQNLLTASFLPSLRDDKKFITNWKGGGKSMSAFSGVQFLWTGEVWSIKMTLCLSFSPRYVFNLQTFVSPGQISETA